MRDEEFGDRFELDLRDALRHELAGIRVGVDGSQIRGRIAARGRTRRTTRLVVLVAAALAVAIAIPLVGRLVLTGPLASPSPSPTAPVAPSPEVEPATITAIDESSGDLVVSHAWPDGRLEEAARYAGALERVREATGDAAATGLPHDAVATAGLDGRLAIALPGGDVLYFMPPDGDAAVAGAIDADTAPAWFGWVPDGRLALLGTGVRLIDPVSGTETMSRLPAGRVGPDWTRGEVELLTWTGDGGIVAVREDPATSDDEVGLIDITVDRPTFVPGLPASVVAATGLETRYGSDGTYPGSWCQAGDLVLHCAGLSEHVSQRSAPAETWYVGRSSEALNPDTVRTADGSGLLVVARAMDAGRGRVIVVEAPGSWREAFAFDAPAYDTSDMEAYLAGQAYLVGVAPGGRSVALRTPTDLVVGDLQTGQKAVLAAGSIFTGWPSAPVVATDVLRAIPACEPPTPEALTMITLSDPAFASLASEGVRPVVSDRTDGDPWRVDGMTRAEPLVADPGWLLTLGLPHGVCVEAAKVEAVSPSDPTAVPAELVTWPIDGGPRAGLLMLVAPERHGDWIVRAELTLTGADRDAILLYHVRTAAP
jgi:hypothetical protein